MDIKNSVERKVMEMIGKEKKYQCDICGEWFKTPNALGAHKRHVHKVEIEKVESNALLDLLRDIHAGIEELRKKGGEYSMKDTEIKEGFDELSEGVVDGYSALMRRIDDLERKVADIEERYGQAIEDGFGVVLKRLDKADLIIPKKIGDLSEDELRRVIEKLLPAMARYNLEVRVAGGKAKLGRFPHI